MARKASSMVGAAVSLSALDLFANAVGALAFLLLLFAVNTIQMVRQPPLTVLTRRLPPSAAGSDYIAILAARGGAESWTWSIRSGTLPEGLRLDRERGEITGTPAASTAGQTFPFDAVVEDARRHSAQARLEIRVAAPKESQARYAEPLVLLTHGRCPEAFADKPYELYLSARGGSGRYRWSAEGLPGGLSLRAATGLVHGSPKTPGKFPLVLRVEDEKKGAGDAAFAVAAAVLEVRGTEPQAAPLAAPSNEVAILTDRLPPAIVGQPYEVMLAGTGTHPLRWSARGLPPGLKLSEDGVLRGPAQAAVTARIVVSMSDSRPAKAPDKTLAMVVRPRPLSSLERIARRGLWGWLGYVLLALGEVALLFQLRRRQGHDVLVLLKLYNVNLIQKADGTTALNGSSEDMEAFQQAYKPKHEKYLQYQRISYAVLAVSVIGYTIFLLH